MGGESTRGSRPRWRAASTHSATVPSQPRARRRLRRTSGSQFSLSSLSTSTQRRIPRRDAPTGGTVDEIFEQLAGEAVAAVPDRMIAMEAQKNVVRVTTWHGQQLQKQIQQVAKINLWDDTTGLVEHLEVAVADNVRLVKSLVHGQLDDLKGIVLRGARAGVHQSVIAEQIEQRFGVTQKRAALIATDQVGKLNGELNQIRQQRLGVRRYRWSSSQDERVRKTHVRLNGTIQEWTKPPVADDRTGERGHPGQPIRCRCQPIPIIDDVLADLGLIDPSSVELGQPSKTPQAPQKPPRLPKLPPKLPQPAPANVPPKAPKPRPPLPELPPALPRPLPANVPPPAPALPQPRPLAAPPPVPKPPIKLTLTGQTGDTTVRLFGRKLTEQDIRTMLAIDTLPAGFSVETSISDVKPQAALDPQAPHWFTSGYLQLSSDFTDARGERAGKLTRRYYRDESGKLTAKHEYLVLPDAIQGAGIGKNLFNAQIASYPALGVEKVSLNAAWVGKYVWTKAGFEWVDKAQQKLVMRLFHHRVEEEVGRAAAKRINAKIRTPRDLASAVVNGKRLGKDFLVEMDDMIDMAQSVSKIKKL